MSRTSGITGKTRSKHLRCGNKRKLPPAVFEQQEVFACESSLERRRDVGHAAVASMLCLFLLVGNIAGYIRKITLKNYAQLV